MVLGLSSAAAPDAALQELVAAAARKGFAALGLREGDGHGVSPLDAGPGVRAALEEAAAAGIRISGYRAGRAGHDLALARLSHTLGAPVVLDGSGGVAARLERAIQMAAAGADVAVVLRGPSVLEEAAFVASAGLTLAWDADARHGSLDRTAESLLQRHPGELRHIRLLGGGPEAAMHEGAEVGAMMRRLALEGYQGTLVLAPSTTRYGVAWQRWLGRRGGAWGCGSRHGAPPRESLAADGMEGRDR